MLQYLLEHGFSFNATGPYDESALQAAAETGHASAATILLKRGATVDTRDDNGQTPLHLAVREGHLDVVKILVAHGADIQAKDHSGNTPVGFSEQFRKRDISSYFNSALRGSDRIAEPSGAKTNPTPQQQ